MPFCVPACAQTRKCILRSACAFSGGRSLEMFGLMNVMHRKVVITGFVTITAVLVGLSFFESWANRTIRFVSGQHLIGGPLPGRSRENLPSVAVESGGRLCCRMLYCDFRFPLPPNTGLVSIEPVTGGFDTIKGAIYVTNRNRGAVDLRAYARAMRRDGFRVTDDGYGFAASSPDGGFVSAEGLDRCRIGFSFFGDY